MSGTSKYLRSYKFALGENMLFSRKDKQQIIDELRAYVIFSSPLLTAERKKRFEWIVSDANIDLDKFLFVASLIYQANIFHSEHGYDVLINLIDPRCEINELYHVCYLLANFGAVGWWSLESGKYLLVLLVKHKSLDELATAIERLEEQQAGLFGSREGHCILPRLIAHRTPIGVASVIIALRKHQLYGYDNVMEAIAHQRPALLADLLNKLLQSDSLQGYAYDIFCALTRSSSSIDTYKVIEAMHEDGTLSVERIRALWCPRTIEIPLLLRAPLFWCRINTQEPPKIQTLSDLLAKVHEQQGAAAAVEADESDHLCPVNAI
jgi:hypothetical protein